MANFGNKAKPAFDSFDVLGIKPGCSAAEIDKAFKKSALKWHPDKNPENVEKAKMMFLKIAEAYDNLKDATNRMKLEEAAAAKQRRAEYEEERKQTSTVLRKEFISKLAERERQAATVPRSTGMQKAGAKRRTKEDRDAAAERKRTRDSSLERLAREAAEIMAQHNAKKRMETKAANASTAADSGLYQTNLSAEDFERLEAEILASI